MPSGSVAPLCFHVYHHHLITYLLHALGHGVTVHRATWRGQDYPQKGPPIRPTGVPRAHALSATLLRSTLTQQRWDATLLRSTLLR